MNSIIKKYYLVVLFAIAFCFVASADDADIEATFERELTYNEQGNHEVAIYLLNQYIENAKPTDFEPYLSRAQSYLALGQADAAIKDIEKAYENNPLYNESILKTETIPGPVEGSVLVVVTAI